MKNNTLNDLELINLSPDTFISLTDSLINIILAAVVSLLIKLAYDKFEAKSGSDASLSSIFLPLTVITAFIIGVVKGSLALSLGLVGALSIVRFRTAIKEPTELVFLFLCIAVGLGFGANLTIFTSIVSVALLVIISGRNLVKLPHSGEEIWVVDLDFDGTNPETTGSTMQIFEQYCTWVKLTRFTSTSEIDELSYEVKVEHSLALDKIKADLFASTTVKSVRIYKSIGIV